MERPGEAVTRHPTARGHSKTEPIPVKTTVQIRRLRHHTVRPEVAPNTKQRPEDYRCSP